MTKNRLEEVNSNLVSLIGGSENKIKLQRVVGGEAPMTTNLDMGGHSHFVGFVMGRLTLPLFKLKCLFELDIWSSI